MEAVSLEKVMEKLALKRAISLEGIIFLAVFILLFAVTGTYMGPVNMINTLLNNSYKLLTNTVFYIMAISVVTGAIASLLTEFRVIALANRLLSPLMKPVYGLPGAAIISIFTIPNGLGRRPVTCRASTYTR